MKHFDPKTHFVIELMNVKLAWELFFTKLKPCYLLHISDHKINSGIYF